MGRGRLSICARIAVLIGTLGLAALAMPWALAALAPTVTSFSPTCGPVGTVVTISGTGFTGATSVKFATTSASFTVNSDTQITASVPKGATTGTISVTTPDGTGVSNVDFSIPCPPTITSFSPTSGAVGTSVTINGTNFTGATSVKFATTSASFTVNSNTQITATVPSGATTGRISVTTPAGTATSSGTFTVAGAPTISSLRPTSGAVGTSVTINGTNFTGATSVKFATTSASFTVNSNTQITATVPSAPREEAGIVDVTVVSPAGSSSIEPAVRFTVTVEAGAPLWPWVAAGAGALMLFTWAILDQVRRFRRRRFLAERVDAELHLGEPEVHLAAGNGPDVSHVVRLVPHLDRGTQHLEEVIRR